MVSKKITGSRLRNSIGSGKILGRIGKGRGALSELSLTDVLGALKGANGGSIGGGGGGGGNTDGDRANVSYFGQGGVFADGLLIGKLIFTRSVTFPLPTGDESQGGCRIAPTGNVTFSFQKNGSGIGGVHIASGATVATFDVSASFVAGDVLSVFTPSPADATLMDVWFNVVGSH